MSYSCKEFIFAYLLIRISISCILYPYFGNQNNTVEIQNNLWIICMLRSNKVIGVTRAVDFVTSFMQYLVRVIIALAVSRRSGWMNANRGNAIWPENNHKIRHASKWKKTCITWPRIKYKNVGACLYIWHCILDLGLLLRFLSFKYLCDSLGHYFQ